LEDWRIKISVLWLLASIIFLAHQILVLMEPGIIAQLMAGEAEGQKIGHELIRIKLKSQKLFPNIRLIW
jgi:hypothetical protein